MTSKTSNSELNKNIVLGLHKQNNELKTKLKAKDEKFINLLDKLKLNIKEKTIRFADYPIIHQIIHLDIEEIKQRIKEE